MSVKWKIITNLGPTRIYWSGHLPEEDLPRLGNVLEPGYSITVGGDILAVTEEGNPVLGILEYPNG